MLRIDKDVVITPQILKRVIDGHAGEAARLTKLERYYLSKNDILNRQMADPTKPNNKIVNPYASYITDTLTGYFMGTPVSYTSLDKTALEGLQEVFKYNDEADENTELAKTASIYGVAYELLYVDENGDLRFKMLDPKECIPVYDNTLEGDLLYFIRYYKEYDIVTDKNFYRIEIISKESITYYKANEQMGNIVVESEIPHYFKLVPVTIYKNNEQLLGDFEPIISLIDAYDKMESDSLNDFEYFCDAYLALYGFTADAEDVIAMKENRVLLMDHDTKAEFITKNSPDITIENMKNRLDTDIHRFSKCPNLTDDSFAGNSSGVAIKYKVMGTENIVSIKERKFKKGLQRRIELISTISALKTAEFDYRDIEIAFNRSLPANDVEIADVVTKLSTLVSQETLLAQIPFVTDVGQEMERVEKERDEVALKQQELFDAEPSTNQDMPQDEEKNATSDKE